VELGIDNEAEFKLVLINIDQAKGTVTFEAFVRACIREPFSKKWLTCTPYAIPTGFIIVLKENSIMPIDISRPAFGFKLSDIAKSKLKSVLSAANLKKVGIQAATSAGSSLVSGATGSGSGRSGSNGSSSPRPIAIAPGPYQGSFSGQTMSPINAPMSSGYGNRVHPITGKVKFHDGIDLAVPEGTPVKAVATGRIIYEGWVKGYGNTLVIDHGGGYMSLYGHLQNGGFIGRIGGTVQMGTVVAISGNTGNSTGAHLHLTIIEGGDGQNILSGVTIDPRKFIKF
jgi:murein DD-endopeptidase MepM/ murein hydrolase activator NlpD